MLKNYVKPMRGRIIVNAIIKMTGTMFEVILPYILAHILNKIVPTRQEKLILMWGLLMVVCSVAAWILNITANQMASKTAATAIQHIRQDLFERSMALSARQIDRFSVASLESRLTSDTYVIHRFLGATLRMGIRSVMLFLGGVMFSFLLDWRLALVLVILIPPLFYVLRHVFNKVHPLFHEVQYRMDNMVQIIRENIRGIRVIKALDKTEHEKNRFSEANAQTKDAEIDARDHMAFMFPAVDIILYTGLGLVILLGALLANRGLTKAGTIMAFMSYFIQITNSIMALNRMFNIYSRATTSAERIEEVLQTPLDKNQKIEPNTLIDLPESDPNVPEVEFKNVTFSYLGKHEDLQNVSFKLYPGQSLGIMGATGAGKSTVTRLLLRQYDVNRGEILVRGVNIKNLRRSDLKELFGIVFQNDFLFHGTVRQNIDFGRDLTDEELIEATRHAQAAEFLESKEGGLDFELASKGVNLSGGQKQRLLLSRALAGTPEILILDDSSSALDFETDARLRHTLARDYGQTTSFIIAQRISSVKDCDQILLLEDGRMLALGTHETLVQTCAPYREIARIQMGENTVSQPMKEEA